MSIGRRRQNALYQFVALKPRHHVLCHFCDQLTRQNRPLIHWIQ